MNVNIDTTANPVPATAAEHPAIKVHRLAKELCAAMRANPDGWPVTMVYANPALTHPIMFLEDREYADITHLVFEYREAHLATLDSKVSAKEIRRLQKIAAGAHRTLLAALVAWRRS